jgi:hypothetical protein
VEHTDGGLELVHWGVAGAVEHPRRGATVASAAESIAAPFEIVP